VISPKQRPLPDNTQHLQETDFHASDGFRTHNPSKQAAIDPHLFTARPLGSAFQSEYTVQMRGFVWFRTGSNRQPCENGIAHSGMTKGKTFFQELRLLSSQDGRLARSVVRMPLLPTSYSVWLRTSYYCFTFSVLFYRKTASSTNESNTCTSVQSGCTPHIERQQLPTVCIHDPRFKCNLEKKTSMKTAITKQESQVSMAIVVVTSVTNIQSYSVLNSTVPRT
jgi:hypothetical protein